MFVKLKTKCFEEDRSFIEKSLQKCEEQIINKDNYVEKTLAFTETLTALSEEELKILSSKA